MKVNRLLLIILLPALLLPVFLNAQIKGTRGAGGFSVMGRHKKYTEVVFGLGACNFLGEVGGANQIGTNFVRDFDFPAVRPSLQMAYRFKFDKRWAVKGGFYYQLVSGADKFTKEIYRKNRNLSFRSGVYELSTQVEFYFTKGEQPAKRYKIRGSKGILNTVNIQSYLFIGIGGIYFNPKAKYDGRWIALQPLGTEGQGLPGARNKYSRFTVVIPYGVGFKQAVNKKWYAGVEFGFRKTYTDYMDDASNVYYDNNYILSRRGATAAHLADPKVQNMPVEVDPTNFYGQPGLAGYTVQNQGGAGQQRGDIRDKDAYMFLNITVGYRIPYKKSFRRKHKSHF